MLRISFENLTTIGQKLSGYSSSDNNNHKRMVLLMVLILVMMVHLASGLGRAQWSLGFQKIPHPTSMYFKVYVECNASLPVLTEHIQHTIQPGRLTEHIQHTCLCNLGRVLHHHVYVHLLGSPGTMAFKG